ncbi:Mg2+ transporter like zinc transport [Fusarium denticulatum]|uniref:Mg2+ transporter like zinc transport n=1 Tax=Fusarium denticulatum TaxID=48507 RepID=A0A8H5UHG8_9HYPO|nr:Mg2+ transporter like zinc transport [Fusarium denticulatum]
MAKYWLTASAPTGTKRGHSVSKNRTLLPVQLFRSHYEATLSAFNSIQTDVGMVDVKLLRQFEEESKLDDASKLYRDLSMTLHKCSMKLAELGRRRKFEEELGARLQEDLKSDSKLKVVVEIYSRMSQSRDSDIESLPGKIEIQRNVHDSYLQARLAGKSLRDSKAMKTLSILTILFLPGAFIATIFSANMFEFTSKNQQVRIYFAIIIPLTAVLMICWVLWLKNTPERGDAESGFRYRPVKNMDWHKEGKED